MLGVLLGPVFDNKQASEGKHKILLSLKVILHHDSLKARHLEMSQNLITFECKFPHENKLSVDAATDLARLPHHILTDTL